MQMLEYYRD